MSDGTEFEVDMSGNLGPMARRFAAELASMNARLKEAEKALSRTESASKALSKSQSKLWNYKEHSVALERLRRGHLAGAPAMARFGRELRGFGVHGATLRKFTVDAAKTEAALRRLYRISGGGLRGAATVTRALASRAWNGGLREKAGSALWAGAKGAAGLAVGGAALAGGGAAMGGGLLGWNMAKTAIEAERMQFALDRVTDGNGARWWQTSSEYAVKFGLHVNEVAQNLMKMKASGFTDSMAQEIFLRMGDLRAVGASTEEIGRALLAIRQIKSIGRLMGEELNQLTEAGVDAEYVYQVLEKRLGKTRIELMRLKEGGKLTSDIVLPAITEAIGVKTKSATAGEAGAAATQGTLSGLWGQFHGAWSVASTRALGSESLAPLKEAVTMFNEWMLDVDGGGKRIGAFGNTLARAFSAAPAIIDKVIWLLDTGLPAAFGGFTAGLESIGAGNAIKGISVALGDMGGPNGASASLTLRQIGNDAGRLVGSLATLCGWLVQTVNWFRELKNSIPSLPPWAETILDYAGPQAAINAPLDAIESLNAIKAWFSGGGTKSSAASTTAALSRTGGLAPDVDLGLGSERFGQIPSVDSVAPARVTRPANISNDWHPTINQTVNVTASETDGLTPGEVGDVVGDRSERRLTESFRQLAYSNG